MLWGLFVGLLRSLRAFKSVRRNRMIIGMLKGVLSLYRAICGYVGTIIILGIIPILLVIFHFQGRTLKDVKDELLNDLETLNSQYKMPATLSGKLNHFEKITDY